MLLLVAAGAGGVREGRREGEGEDGGGRWWLWVGHAAAVILWVVCEALLSDVRPPLCCLTCAPPPFLCCTSLAV